MVELPLEVNEVVIVARGGRVLRWRGDDAGFLGRLLHSVLTEPTVAPDVPEPEDTMPFRQVTDMEGRYVVGQAGDLWLARERPPECYQLHDLVPEMMRGGRKELRQDSFGNAYVLAGPLCRVHAVIEAAPVPTTEDE